MRTTTLRTTVATAATGLLGGLLVLLMILGVAPAATVERLAFTAPTPAEPTRFTARVLTLVNERRAAHDLPALRTGPCVTGFADRWAGHLAATGTLAHSDLGTLLGRCDGTYAAENLLRVRAGATPRDLVRTWMATPCDRATLLSARPRVIGLGLAWDPAGHRWVTVLDLLHH